MGEQQPFSEETSEIARAVDVITRDFKRSFRDSQGDYGIQPALLLLVASQYELPVLQSSFRAVIKTANEEIHRIRIPKRHTDQIRDIETGKKLPITQQIKDDQLQNRFTEFQLILGKLNGHHSFIVNRTVNMLYRRFMQDPTQFFLVEFGVLVNRDLRFVKNGRPGEQIDPYHSIIREHSVLGSGTGSEGFDSFYRFGARIIDAVLSTGNLPPAFQERQITPETIIPDILELRNAWHLSHPGKTFHPNERQE